MASRNWDAGSENGKEDAFELLQRVKADTPSTLPPNHNDSTTPTSRLPAKTLSLRSKKHVVISAACFGLLVLVLIVGLSWFLSALWIFFPDTSFFKINSPVSCDLEIQNGTIFQVAFTINLRGADHLTFTQAKAIDVVWQLFVGAGGRFIMAWISYKVFMDGLTRITEQSPISYNLYACLTFSTTSLFSTYYALKAVFFSKGWRSKCFLLWFGISTIYVLGFPTLISATAGYVSPSTSGFNMSDGVFLTSSSDSLGTCYDVIAGALIGYTNGTLAQGPPVSVYNAYSPSEGPRATDCYYTGSECTKIPDFQKDYPLFWSLANASVNDSPPVFDSTNTTTVSESPYGYSQTSVSKPWYPYQQNYTTNITIEGRLYRFRDYRFAEGIAYEAAYCYKNQTIPDLEALAECLPESYFVWGFSSLMVYVILSAQVVWFFGMYIVWLDANLKSALCRSGRKVRGHFRAVADLSEAMEEILGDESCAYSDSQLARELCVQPGVRYYANDGLRDDVSHIGLSSRRSGRIPFNSTKLYGKREKDR